MIDAYSLRQRSYAVGNYTILKKWIFEYPRKSGFLLNTCKA